MERNPEQKDGGKRGANAMTGDIDEPVESEQDCRNEAGKPIPLVGAFAQRINFSNEKNESDDNKNDREPTKLGPKPEPIALWVNRAPVAVGSCAKNGKDIFKIAKTDSDPGRIANKLKDVGKDPPAEIVGDAGVGEIAKMKSFECLPAKKQ